jgi:very-short-patch-repair endonuclease
MARVPSRPPELCRGPFRASEAIRDGLLTPAQVRSAAWRGLFRDVYLAADLPHTHEMRIRGAVLFTPPGTVVAGTSAATVWGVRFGDEVRPVELRSPTIFGPVRGMTIHVGFLPPDQTTVFRSIPVTSVLRTAFDIACWMRPEAAVPWIDALIHARAVSKSTLVSFAAAQRPGRGTRVARTTLHRCDPRAESPPESELRLLLHTACIMVVPQHWVMRDGEVVARVDLALPDLRLAIEYDGQWHSDPNQLTRDRRRLREISQAGWYVYHVTRDDLRDPDRLIANIRSVIASLERSRG